MNLRPLGYEPSELPSCSTPRRVGKPYVSRARHRKSQTTGGIVGSDVRSTLRRVTWLDALGWAGSALLVYSLMQARVLRFRALNLVASLLLTVFNALLGIVPMIALNAVLSIINLWFIVQLTRQRHNDAAFEVLEVKHYDAYLRHVLRVNDQDIRQYFPDETWKRADPERAAFLIQRGDETVGVVLSRDAGEGVAQVELDYVTPRFRDFAPGESGMVAPYYERLGFRREGDAYALDLA